jgi:hypothetical protein
MYYLSTERPASEAISLLAAIVAILSVHIGHSAVRRLHTWITLITFLLIECGCVSLISLGASDPKPTADIIAFGVAVTGIFGLHVLHVPPWRAQSWRWLDNSKTWVSLLVLLATLGVIGVCIWGIKPEVFTIAAAIAGIFSVHISHLARRRRQQVE